MKSFTRSQVINAPVEQIWEFIISPDYRSALRDQELDIDDIASTSESLYSGQIMNYDLGTCLLKTNYTIEIAEMRPYNYMLKTQIVGPFKEFYHHYTFTQLDDGRVMLEDRVEYKLPNGIWSRIVLYFWVLKKINKILDYRTDLIDRLFNQDVDKEE